MTEPNPPPAPVSDAAMRELCEKADPAWCLGEQNSAHTNTIGNGSGAMLADFRSSGVYDHDANARFAVAARRWVPWALERLALMSGPECERCKRPTVPARPWSEPMQYIATKQWVRVRSFLCPRCYESIHETEPAPAPRESER